MSKKSSRQEPPRYLIVCGGCKKQIIGSADHCQICPHCERPNPLWRKLKPKEHHALSVDLILI